jgi:hypothetical protein
MVVPMDIIKEFMKPTIGLNAEPVNIRILSIKKAEGIRAKLLCCISGVLRVALINII